jgi:HSP20 family protein
MSYLTVHPKRAIRPNHLNEDWDSLLSQFFSSAPACQAKAETESNYAPAVDVQENDEAFVITADVPGIAKEDLKIDIIENTVSIEGHRKQESEVNKDQYRRIERSYGTFKRNFKIPGGFVHDNTKALFENGVLTLTLPKPEVQKPKRIEVSGN